MLNVVAQAAQQHRNVLGRFIRWRRETVLSRSAAWCARKTGISTTKAWWLRVENGRRKGPLLHWEAAAVAKVLAYRQSEDGDETAEALVFRQIGAIQGWPTLTAAEQRDMLRELETMLGCSAAKEMQLLKEYSDRSRLNQTYRQFREAMRHLRGVLDANAAL